MSEFNLIDIVGLIRAEIRRTQVGPVKKIVGKTGEQGPQGEQGIQGPQGPRGNDGKQGPAGAKGNQGRKGDKGLKGSDGDDGVGIARIDQDTVDGAIVVFLTDGNSYTIEMPLVDSEGNVAKEVHFKSGGSGGGSGMIDLSHFVKRPTGMNNKWLVYRETDGSNQGEWTPVTTDLVATNPATFRDQKGRFAPAPEELDDLTNQRAVNEFLWKYTQESSDSHDNLQEIVENGLTLQASIEQEVDLLNDKVAALEGAVGEHSLIFTGTQANPRAGQFNLKDQAYQLVSYVSEASYIILSDTDRNDKPINLARIQVGDVIRLSDISREAVELKVTAIADNNYTFENLGGELDRLSELPYDFVLLSSFDPAGLATIDYVDERDKTKLSRSGGKMDGLIDMADQPIVNLPEPSGSKSPATKKYVDDKLKDATTTATLWKYCEGKSKYELSAYEFTAVFPGGHGIEIIMYPYIKGRWWAPASATNYSHGIGEQYVTITDHGGACAIGFKAWKWWFLQKGKNSAGNDTYHNALEGDYYKHGYPDANKLKDQHYYNLNFPSPFPLVMFPESMHTSGQGAFGVEDELEGISPDAPDMGEVMNDDL